MQIRPATTDDVDGIRRVARRTWDAAYRDVIGPEEIDAAMAEWYGDAAVRRSIEREETGYFVAADGARGGEVAGYASAGPTDEPGTGELYSIYVDPDRWGDGVGTELLSRAVQHVLERGSTRMLVRVLAENDVGRAFYEARGFELEDAGEIDLFTGGTARECVYGLDIE